MLWPITLAGAVTGWFLAGIPGTLLGALLGQVFDRRLQLDLKTLFGRLIRQPPLRGDELLFVLLGRLAKSQGRVTEAHIQAARAEMQRRYMDAAQQRLAIQAFGRGKSGKDALQPALKALHKDQDEVKALLQACWRLARAEGALGETQTHLILQWGQWASWTEEAILAQDSRRPKSQTNTGSQYQKALALLGVSHTTSLPEIKLAYRRLLSQYHPDKLVGQGASTEQLHQATERTRELHQAYELVQRYQMNR